MKLGVIEFVQSEGHRIVVLDNYSSHLNTEGVSVNMKRFVVVWIYKESVLCHKGFHAFESKVHIRGPIKCLFS